MGTEFNELFDEWSYSYDETVSGHDAEYEEVFFQYDKILKTVAAHARGTVVEFGVGTGNLTSKLLRRGLDVIGIEPSANMRKIAQSKHPDVKIIDGDFLNFHVPKKVDSFVSTYAFHHLTDEEKTAAISNYSRQLNPGGKIVFADTIFITQEAKEEMIQEAMRRGFKRLAEDLQREYYTIVPVLASIFEDHHFSVSFRQLNRFVWLIDAELKGENDHD
ncbi:class I SAM-dependent methyltransferase [Heyndrickxia acidiproducens]|uniref:class I SAM-dependent methyltransferase n=1 Tax=Heyndrickxia acidiproducens TaxID=1121084 RepID=UPI00037BF222|nr:class I SAM-dependent methyltransferase [Heyndrickxia acidiproducens]